MAAILNSAILNLAILDSAILVFPLKLTHTCQDWFPPFAQKKPSLIHSDSTWWWQPSWILPCWIQPLPSWISLIHSDSTWWWQPSWILPSWIWPSWFSHLSSDSLKLTHTCQDWFHHLHKKTSLIHSDSTWWWQPSWILPCWIQTLPSWIQTPCYLLSDSLKNTLTPLWLWLKLIQSDSNSFILTQLDDGSHLEFCHLEFGHLGFSHLSFSSQTHSHLPRLVPTICTKKNFTHSFWLNLMMAAILNSAMLDSDTAILDSDTLLSSLRFTQKHSHSTLTLTQTNSIWLKLIHSHSTWWWQPSWILPSWIQPP